MTKKKALDPIFERLDQLMYIIGAGDGTPYCYFHFDDKKELLSRGVGFFHKAINKDNFHRIGKSYIVNMNYVKFEDEREIILKNGFKIVKSKPRTNRPLMSRICK
jgi:DNA-binding LytR/AlgR family response regulator